MIGRLTLATVLLATPALAAPQKRVVPKFSTDFGAGKPAPRKRVFKLSPAQSTPAALNSAITVIPWTNGQGQITGAQLQGLHVLEQSIFTTMGTWDVNGVYSPSVPASTVGLVTTVPQRVATGVGATSTTQTDFLVCLNGPTEVDLEATPIVGTTHVLKDCRSGTGNAAIAVVPQGGLTIDRVSSYSMTVPAQSVTVTYTSLGWSIY